jgi:hypothetical protein
MIKGVQSLEVGSRNKIRYLDGLFTLESLSEDCRILKKHLRLSGSSRLQMKKLNRSLGEDSLDDLPSNLYQKLVDYVSYDLKYMMNWLLLVFV